MSKERNYTQSLFADEKYFEKLRAIYDEMSCVRRFKRRLDDIEKEVSWYVGNKQNGFIPLYLSFDNYAKEHYTPKDNNLIIYPKYKELLGEYRSLDIPVFVYCLALLAHLLDEAEVYAKQHENDSDLPSESILLEFFKLDNKISLLYHYLDQKDTLVAAFVNSIDMTEVEYLDDDINKLDALSVKHRFMYALRLRNKSMCFKLLGRMRELDEGEDYYFEALSHYINEEYSESIRYANKVNKDNIDYPSTIALKLECYSLKGDLDGFVECINENNKLSINYWHFEYLLMSLYLKIDVESDYKLQKGFDTENNKLDYSVDPYYMNLLYCLVADIIVEGLGILEEKRIISEAIGEDVWPVKLCSRFIQLQTALSIFPYKQKKYLDFEYIRDKTIAELKDKAERDLLELLLNKNPQRSFDKIKKAFLCQLNLGDTRGFLKNINNNFDALVVYSDNGEKGADELIRLAYIEGIVIGSLDDRIKEKVESAGTIDLTKDISDKRIYNFLSKQGRLAYEAAEWIYNKSREEDYGWRDAGMISLSFYRVLELELNKKIIIPLLSKIGYDSLNDEYKNCKNTFTGNKKQYENKWDKILNTYKSMENDGFSGNGFMLGVLDYFFRAIGSEYDPADSLATLIRNNLKEMLNSCGLEKLDEGFFESITNKDTRDKYRNPPAHTKYLAYEIACECREVFREKILQLNDMLKKTE